MSHKKNTPRRREGDDAAVRDQQRALAALAAAAAAAAGVERKGWGWSWGWGWGWGGGGGGTGASGATVVEEAEEEETLAQPASARVWGEQEEEQAMEGERGDEEHEEEEEEEEEEVEKEGEGEEVEGEGEEGDRAQTRGVKRKRAEETVAFALPAPPLRPTLSAPPPRGLLPGPPPAPPVQLWVAGQGERCARSDGQPVKGWRCVSAALPGRAHCAFHDAQIRAKGGSLGSKFHGVAAHSHGSGRWEAKLRHTSKVVHLGRGLHSSTFLLNLSAFYGIGGARRGRLGGV